MKSKVYSSIMVYNSDAEVLENLAEEIDTTVAELVELLMEYLPKMKEDNNIE